MNPKLSLEIGADIKGMEAALKRADQLLKQHERNYKGVQSAISQNTSKTLQLEKSISQLNTEYKRGNISQSQYSKETGRLTNELAQVNNETADYQKELRRLDREMDRVAQSTANYANNAKRTGAASNQAAAGMRNLGRTTGANAVPAMTSFSQIVQDAPYGIRGVANNIQQLTMQMGYLSKSAGGVGGALKAMGASLMGPTGILLGVSLVTTALVTYGDKLFDSKTETEKLKEETEKAREELDKFIDSLNTLNQVEISANIDVAKEKAALYDLQKQLIDTNNSEEDRLAAFNKLQQKYPKILKTLDFEKSKLEGLGGAYDEITKKLNERATSDQAAKARAENIEQIEKLKGKEKELENQVRKQQAILQKDYAKTQEVLNAQEKAIETLSQTDLARAERLRKQNPQIIKANEEEIRLLKEKKEVVDKIRSLESENTKLTAKVTLVAEDVEEPKNPKDVEPIRVPVTAIFESNNSGLSEWAAKELKALEALRLKFAPLSTEYKVLTKQINILKSSLNGGSGLEQLHKSAEEAITALEPIRGKMQEITAEQMFQAQLLSQAFGSMASSMADSMIEGTFSIEEFGKTFLKTISKIMIQLGQQALMEKLISKGQLSTDFAVSQGNAAVAATSAAAAMGPAGVIALPGLLASMSSIVGGFFGGLQAFADGGVVGGSSLYGDKILARVNSKELILNTDQQKKLYKQLQNPQVVAVGQNEPVEIFGETFISGDMIRVAYQRAEKKRGRIS